MGEERRESDTPLGVVRAATPLGFDFFTLSSLTQYAVLFAEWGADPAFTDEPR